MGRGATDPSQPVTARWDPTTFNLTFEDGRGGGPVTVNNLGGASTYVFGGPMVAPSAAINLVLGWCPVAGTVSKVYASRTGGTGATVNARRAGLALRSSDLSVTVADSKSDFGTLQNTTVAAGDLIEMQIVTTTGSPSQITVQVEITPA